MVYHEASDQVFDLVEGKRINKKRTAINLGFGVMDKTSNSQRFSVGLSGYWRLHSDQLDRDFGSQGKAKKGNLIHLFKLEEGWNLRWQARQIMKSNGRSFEPNPEQMQEFKLNEFDIGKTENVMRPLDCSIGLHMDSENVPEGEKMFLNIENGDFVMNNEKGAWTFEYADL